MAKRDTTKYGREIDEFDEEDDVAEEPTVSYNSSKEVRLQLRISARVKAFGPVTGKEYVWERAGAIVEVDETDSAGLLEKRLGNKTCCGGNADNLKVFILVE